MSVTFSIFATTALPSLHSTLPSCHRHSPLLKHKRNRCNDHSHPLLLLRQGEQHRRLQQLACHLQPFQVIADLYERYVELIGTPLDAEGNTMADGYAPSTYRRTRPSMSMR